ncbi:MAG: hypothetical protein J7474_10410, partial [Arthrobacter sp.]|nr:hypothetical protein [Arthrobacter sp.]
MATTPDDHGAERHATGQPTIDRQVVEHSVPGSGPYAITTGPDGALWYTLEGSGEIGRLVPGGFPATFQLAAGSGAGVTRELALRSISEE